MRVAWAGLVSGPSTLKMVRMPSSRRTGATYFMALWYFWANIKQMFSSRRARSIVSLLALMLTPSASRQSAAPLLEEAARLPCLAMRTPAAAAIMPAVVEILKLPDLSPPVPTMSRMSPSLSRGSALERMDSAAPAISSSVSPLMDRAVRKEAISAGLA